MVDGFFFVFLFVFEREVPTASQLRPFSVTSSSTVALPTSSRNSIGRQCSKGRLSRTPALSHVRSTLLNFGKNVSSSKSHSQIAHFSMIIT